MIFAWWRQNLAHFELFGRSFGRLFGKKKKLLMCQKKFRFERRSLFNDQILTMDARRRTTVIVIGVTVAANISRVAGTLVGIHSIDTTTLEEEMNTFCTSKLKKKLRATFLKIASEVAHR